MSSLIGNTICPPMIVVGILNTNRPRDLTPTKDTTNKNLKDAGGGKLFLSFIEKELIPYIDSAYSASSYRIVRRMEETTFKI